MIKTSFGKFFCIIHVFRLCSAKYTPSSFCEFGFCKNYEYCCGDNVCCAKSTDLCLLWVGISVFLLTIVIAFGIRWCWKRSNNKYVLLTSLPEEG